MCNFYGNLQPLSPHADQYQRQEGIVNVQNTYRCIKHLTVNYVLRRCVTVHVIAVEAPNFCKAYSHLLPLIAKCLKCEKIRPKVTEESWQLALEQNPVHMF